MIYLNKSVQKKPRVKQTSQTPPIRYTAMLSQP